MDLSADLLTLLERLVKTHSDPTIDPSRAAWHQLLADTGFDDAPLTVFEFSCVSSSADAHARDDRFLNALMPAIERTGATNVSVNDTAICGLTGLERYEAGHSWVASFPSAALFVEAMLDPDVVMSLDDRRAAVIETQLLAGRNLASEMMHTPRRTHQRRPSHRVASKVVRLSRSSMRS